MKPTAQAVCTAALLLVGGLAAAQVQQVPPPVPPPAASQQQTGDAERISVADCQQAVAKKKAILVDVRGEGAYRAGHIAGAVLLPSGIDIKAKAEEFKKAGKTVVTYCS